jgi:PmbA protein
MNAEKNREFQELAHWVTGQAGKAGAGESRLRISRRRSVELRYRDRRPEIIKEATTMGMYLEIYSDNRFAGRSTPDFRKSTLDGFISDLIDEAGIMEEDPYRTLPDPKYYRGRTTRDLQLADSSHDRLTAAERHEMVRALEDACLAHDIKNLISLEASEYDEVYEELAISSNGFEGYVRTTNFGIGTAIALQDEGDRRPEGYHFVSCRHLGDLPSPKECGLIAVKRANDLLGARKIPTETLPVIIENRVASRILWGLLGPLSARNIDQHQSFLADMKGKKFAGSLLTVRDEPFIPRGPGSRYYDGDGFPARERVIIREGVVNEFLVDWYYGRKLGWEPNSGSLSNAVIPSGSRSVGEIIRDLGRCILVTDFIGGNSNPTTGDFSVGIIGKLFDKSGFVCNVAEMNLADNHLRFWNRLVETANDPWTYSAQRFPSLVIDGVVVAGT